MVRYRAVDRVINVRFGDGRDLGHEPAQDAYLRGRRLALVMYAGDRH
jgi:hypothetical protein